MGVKLHKMAEGIYAFHCPGCECGHQVWVRATHPCWTWNGSMEAPTFFPSIKCTGGHYAPGHTGACWCTYNAEHPDDPAGSKCELCHTFVTDGKIQFLSDCTHKLVGQTVEIPDWDDC